MHRICPAATQFTEQTLGYRLSLCNFYVKVLRRSSIVVEPLVMWPARKPKPLVILVATLSVVAEPVDLSFTVPEDVLPLLQVSLNVALAITVPAGGAALQLAGPVVVRVAFDVPPVTFPVQPLEVVVEVIVLSVVLRCCG